MTGFEILDLVIGMIFIYFLLSLICMSLQEIYARFWRLRMFNLKKWLTDTFSTIVTQGTGSTVSSECLDSKTPWKLLVFALKNLLGLKSTQSNSARQIQENTLGNRIWCNLVVDGLTQSKRGASYLSRNTFVQALLTEIHLNGKNLNATKPQSANGHEPPKEPIKPYDFESIKNSIIDSAVLTPAIQQMLLQLHHESFSNLDTFKLKIGAWFDEAMERNTGTYKKNAQNAVLIFSILVTLAANVDSIKLANYFYDNKDQAAKVADAAESMIKDKEVIARIQALKDHAKDTATAADTALLTAIKTDLTSIREQHDKLVALKLPIGWGSDDDAPSAARLSAGQIVSTVAGWIITAIAVSLGAPFWFDMLNKLVNLRSAGRKPEEIKPNEAKTTSASTENAFA